MFTLTVIFRAAGDEAWDLVWSSVDTTILIDDDLRIPCLITCVVD